MTARVTPGNPTRVPELGRQWLERAREVPPRALLWAAGALILALILELLRSRGLVLADPSPLLLLLVVAAAAVDGLRPALICAVVVLAYTFYFFSQGPWPSMPGNLLRVGGLVIAVPALALLVGDLRDRLVAAEARVRHRERLGSKIDEFTRTIAEAPADAVAQTIAARLPVLVRGDTVLVTLVDPASNRHFIRAVAGASADAAGTEVVPGVGVSGQAIRERRLTVAERPDGKGSVACVPAIHGDRVVATATVARRAGRPPFSPDDRVALAAAAAPIALAAANALLRVEVGEISPRDTLTGLHSRAYLHEALEQLLATRASVPAEERRPLSVILLDVDAFGSLNERYGRGMADSVLRAVGTVVASRFGARSLTARIHGDAFFVVMDGADSDAALAAATALRDEIRALKLAADDGQPIALSVSAGCATFTDGADSAAVVIRAAEAALQTARWSAAGSVVGI